jgi:transcriptional regulator with XRE-family HTH domain
VPATETIGPLRAARQAQGLSLADVARRAGVDQAQLSRVERGLEGFSIDSLYRVAQALELEELARHLEPYRHRKSATPAIDRAQGLLARDQERWGPR